MAAIEKEKHVYELIGGALCLDFINTRGTYDEGVAQPNERLDSYGEILNWARQVGIIDPEEERALDALAARKPERAETALSKAKELRGAIRSAFLASSEGRAPEARRFAHLNRMIGEAMSHARIAPTQGGYDWDWEPAEDNLERILWPVAKSAADLLVSGKLARVHECAGHTCGWLFLDTSKNHSRRWCDMKECGNAAKARRHYHRKTESRKQKAEGS